MLKPWVAWEQYAWHFLFCWFAKRSQDGVSQRQKMYCTTDGWIVYCQKDSLMPDAPVSQLDHFSAEWGGPLWYTVVMSDLTWTCVDRLMRRNASHAS